jgi:HEAT repeat protein
MLMYQLVNDDDVLGRIEAVDVLADRPADQNALNALILATRNDRFWAVRSRAVDAIGAWGSDSSRAGIAPLRRVVAALVAATRDPDARVRQHAAAGLGPVPLTGTTARDVAIRLKELARNDPSYIVRGAALASDIRLEKNAALPLAKQLMQQQLWADVVRGPAITALKAVGTTEALELAQQYASPAQ